MPATALHVLQPKGQFDPAANCLHVVICIIMSLVQLIRVGDDVGGGVAPAPVVMASKRASRMLRVYAFIGRSTSSVSTVLVSRVTESSELRTFKN